jgi:hypothetical protein
MLLWCVIEKATLTGDGSLKRQLWVERKRLQWHYRLCFLLNYIWNYYLVLMAIKNTSRGRELRCTHTHRPHIMGRKELEPWSPHWLRQELMEANNGLQPNDPNHDEKHPADAARPLCKCDLDCQFHMSLDHETYVMRYWSYSLPTSPFNWGWDEEKLRKVVSVLTFTL